MTLDELLLNHGGWLVTDTYIGRQGSWYRSRAVIRLPDGATETECSTVLNVLTAIRFTEEERAGKYSYWLDKDPTNETLENIGLVSTTPSVKPARASASNIAFPSGTPEYREAYRKKNQKKYNEYNKRYQKKLRELARTVTNQTVKALNRPAAPGHDTYLDDMEQKLRMIVDSIKGDSDE